MDEVRNDPTMRPITWTVHSMYVFALVYFAHGFWAARAVFYSPPIGVMIAAYIGVLCIAGMLGLFGILLFAKQPGMMLAKIFFLHKKECTGGTGQ